MYNVIRLVAFKLIIIPLAKVHKITKLNHHQTISLLGGLQYKIYATVLYNCYGLEFETTRMNNMLQKNIN